MKSKFRWKCEQGKSFFTLAIIKGVRQISIQIEIRNTDITLHTVISLEKMIFGKSRATEQKLEQIRKQQGLLLIAYTGVVPVGFKLGYVIENGQRFFSWLGGVHEDYRRQGIAQSLLEMQEQHVRTLGIKKIYFTTFDRFPAMINLGENNQYLLAKTALEEGEVKYWYEKRLT